MRNIAINLVYMSVTMNIAGIFKWNSSTTGLVYNRKKKSDLIMINIFVIISEV